MKIINLLFFIMVFFTGLRIVSAQYETDIISSVLEGPSLEDSVQKTTVSFFRESIAYDSDGFQLDNSKPRFQKLAIFNRPEYILLDQFDKDNIVALAYSNNFLWGGQPWTDNNTGNCLYKSTDGQNWQTVVCIPSGKIKSIYITSQNLILIGVSHDGGKVYAYDIESESLSLVLNMLTPLAYAMHWSWGELGGFIYLGEYGERFGGDNARRLYKSLDGGITWNLLYDPLPVEGYHVHLVRGDDYRSHLYWSHGDGFTGAGSRLFRSIDNGNTWQLLSDSEQPTAGIARSEGMYFGSDSGSIGIYRFLNGATEGEYVCSDLVKGYIWDMQNYSGVLYATSLNYGLWGPPTVLISRDGKNWGNLYQWPIGVSGLRRFVGNKDGIIYAIMEDCNDKIANLNFPEPIIRTSWGINIEGEVSNLLLSNSASSFEDCQETSWLAYGDANLEITTEKAYSGYSSLKVSNNYGGNVMRVTSPILRGDFPAGTKIMAVSHVSGWNNIDYLTLQIRDRSNGLSINSKGKKTGVSWSKLFVTWELPNDSQAISVDMVTSTANLGDVFFIDGVGLFIDQRTDSFQIGGQPRCSEILSHNIDFPDYWTDIFFWQVPSYTSSSVLEQNIGVLKTWAENDSNSYWQLLLDSENNIKLEKKENNNTETLLSIQIGDFLPKSLFCFALVKDVNNLNLNINTPEGWLCVSRESNNIFYPKKVFWGSDSYGRLHAGGVYSNNRVYNKAMNKNQIVEVINDILNESWKKGDFNMDGEIDILDLEILINNWLKEGCGFIDVDDNGIVNMHDLVVLSKYWRWGK